MHTKKCIFITKYSNSDPPTNNMKWKNKMFLMWNTKQEGLKRECDADEVELHKSVSDKFTRCSMFEYANILVVGLIKCVGWCFLGLIGDGKIM